MKSCKKCNQKKDKQHFHTDKNRKDGLYPYCKDCRRTYYGQKKRVHKKIGEMDGYLIVSDTRYPCIIGPNGRQRVHRYVIEKKLGRPLNPGEVVHHKDGNKNNWSEENLVLMKDKRHRQLEGHLRYGYKPIFKCKDCGKERRYPKSFLKNGKLNTKKYQCSKCYYKSGGAYGRSQQK